MERQSLEPLTVSELTQQVRELIESNFDQVACLGEISNLVRARSGHLYFTLKDENAQISAVMWKSRAQRLKFELQDGLEVVLVGPIQVYPPRGSYQLGVEQAFPQGLGPLELAFRQLQEKLAAEGLFDPARKRPLPSLPRKIAIVTSATGAAVRDILQVLTKRWPVADLVIVPVPVQGPTAAPQIAEGIRQAALIPDVDLIITGRGGGSLEDLWPFNEEVVARAIAASPVPVISAVGHEIDVSISDLVADRRALTPTEAAQIAVPDIRELKMELIDLQTRLTAGLRFLLQQARHQLDAIASRRVLQHPIELLSQPRRLLDEQEQRLCRAIQLQCARSQEQLRALAARLEDLSPLKVLARGYSITSDAVTGALIQSAKTCKPGQMLRTRLNEGEVVSSVVDVVSEKSDVGSMSQGSNQSPAE